MKTELHIPAMDCPTEEQLIRSRLSRVRGIQDLRFDLVQSRLIVEHLSEAGGPMRSALLEIGMVPTTPEDLESGQTSTVRRPVVSRSEWIQMAAAFLLAIGAEAVELTTDSAAWVPFVLALAAIAIGGREMLVKGWRSVRSFTLGINFLMTIAVTGAILIGEWGEAAMVTVLFALAEKIEQYALDRSRGAIRDLMKLVPDLALVRQDSGEWKEVGARSVPVGSVVRVRPGERIALDGAVLSGTSSVNQAPITGESMPVEKGPGEELFAGSINGTGAIEYEVTRPLSDSAISRIVRMVQQAQADRGQTQRFVDRFARLYTPIVVVAAVLVAVGPPLLVGASFETWLYQALVLLVIACPCALVISTPVTVVSGLAAAARNGTLVKGGAYLETGGQLRVIALDKTGTLTEGLPSVTDVIPLRGKTSEEVFRLAVALEAHSEHPIAAAFRRDGRAPTTAPPVAPGSFRAVVGRGLRGEVGGVALRLGNHRYAHESGICTPELESMLKGLEEQGKTAIVLFDDAEALGVFGVADTLRPESREAVAMLRDLGVTAVILTGDNQRTAAAVGRAAGIREVHGELLPEDKLALIQEMSNRPGAVGMVGDGINDAPALAKADIGFAMGMAGTDTAIETADVSLMNDDLRSVSTFIWLSRKTVRLLRQNIWFAVGIKALFFVLALGGVATLWMAVVADMGASLLVTANGLRLLRSRRP